MAHVHEFVIAANRLPVRRDDQGGWTLSPGGLVTALIPVMRKRSSSWIGWSGEAADPDTPSTIEPFEHDGLYLDPISLSQDQIDDYYEGFSNGTIWPLYHSGALSTQYHRHWWDAYRRVNAAFARRAIETTAEGGTLWVHDYQLQLVPKMVRDARPDLRIGFFLHIPFPPAELFQRLPWRTQIAEGLLGADIVGFQTPEDAQLFLSVCRRMLDTPGTFLEDDNATLDWEGREVTVGAFPISIDVESIEVKSREPDIIAAAADLWVQVGSPKTLLLGVDRLDYTKGIDVRLRALHELLADGDLDPGDVALIQVATPSRDDVRGYAEMRERIERLVSVINGDFATMGTPVVHYLHQNFPFDELLTMYVAADVMLVTPYRDGMNLVAKEYVAAQTSGRGALVLSEFAGTAVEFTDAYLCNPFDLDGLKRVLLDAINAPAEDKRRRMDAMRSRLHSHDVHHWAGTFLHELR